MGKKDTPESPDFTKLAEQMGIASRQNVIENAFANRPDIYTPFGNVTWDRPAYEPPMYLDSGSGGVNGGGTAPTNGIYSRNPDGTPIREEVRDPNAPRPAPGDYSSVSQAAMAAPYDYAASGTGLSRTGTPVPDWGSVPVEPGPRPLPAEPPIDGRTGLPSDSGRGDSGALPVGPNGYPVAPYPGTDPVDPGDLAPGTGTGTGGGSTVGGAGGGAGSYDPRDWAMHLNLPPAVLQALQAQQGITRDRSLFAGGDLMSDAVNDYRNNSGFWNALGNMSDPALARNRAEDAIYQRASSRLDPQWGSRESQLQTQLANQGLTPGSTAYTNQMRDFNLGRNDAYQTAMNEAIMGGGQEASRQQAQELQARQQGISEGYQQQYGGLNALNAFLGGQQVGMPGMPSFNQAGTAQTPNYMGAGQAQYGANLNATNMQNAAMNNLMGGGAQMAGMLPFMM